jgi:hypothetical protein
MTTGRSAESKHSQFESQAGALAAPVLFMVHLPYGKMRSRHQEMR